MKKILLTLILFLTISMPVLALPEKPVEAKDFSYLFNSINGLSESQLKQHNTLYLRYVKKLNELNEKIEKADKSTANAAHSEYRSLKIDRSFSNNGVLLHEMYFSNLTSKNTELSKELKSKICSDFGSFENYISDLQASMRATRNGWVISVYNCTTNKIENYIFESHDLNVPVNSPIILAIDVWEHSYMIDYGIDKESYIKTLFKNIDWQIVSKRYSKALKN